MTILEIKNRIYNDFIASFKNAITPLRQSFFEQISNSIAATINLVYIYIDRVQRESFLTTCTDDRVKTYFAPLKNISQKLATKSKGVVRFYGVDGATIDAGIKLSYNSQEYITISSATIASGYADVECESVDAGDITNTSKQIDIYLQSSIEGIDNKAYSEDGFSGAIDDESIDSLRTRAKQKFATASNVNNANYYVSLANELPNVKASFVSSNMHGSGTFGVTILTYSNDGVAIQQDIDEVASYFKEKEAIPEYVECDFFLPKITKIDMQIQLAVNNDSNKKIVKQAAMDYVYLFQKIGGEFSIDNLSKYLQTLGARVISPDTTQSIVTDNNEVLDLGVIEWL